MDTALSTTRMLKAQWRIIVALMLHDIRSRMGGNALGFFVMGVCWPLAHMLVLLAINAGLGRAPPYGDSAALWYATGVIPFLAFQYMSRWIMLGIVFERPLLSFPVVKTVDILFARAIVEVLNAGLVVLIMFAIFLSFRIDFMPRDIVQASSALLAMMLLGLAWGIVNAIIAAAFPLWINVFFLSQILLWMASGIVFVPDALPASARLILSYIPPLQGVEWMRSAYYDGFGAGILDKPYLVSFSVSTLLIGLAMERLLRGKLLRP